MKHHLLSMQISNVFIEKIDGCKNDPANSPTTKVHGHIPSGFSMSTISSFKNIENKHTEVKVV